MRSSGRWIPLLVIAVLHAACSPAAPFREPTPERDGAYRFESRADGRVLVEGTFTVTGEAVALQASPGPCVRDLSADIAGAERQWIARFDCGANEVWISVVDPARGSRATVERRVVKTVDVCREYKADLGGGQSCARWEKERQESYVKTSVALRAVRVATPEVAEARDLNGAGGY